MTTPTSAPAAMQVLRNSLQRIENFVMSREGLTELQRAQGLYYAVAWLIPMIGQALGNVDPHRPAFIRHQDWLSKVGLDNPDNLYAFAQISDDGDYRIWGSRGDATDLVVQVIAGTPGVGSLGVVHSTLAADELQVDAHGNFEIVLSTTYKSGNWMKIKPAASYVLCRQTFSDWSQNKGQIFIDRLDGVGTSGKPLDETEMARRIAEVGHLLTSYVEFFWDFNLKMVGPSPVNAISAPYATQGGIAGQHITNGKFLLAGDEALIVTLKPVPARYFGILLADVHWFITFDYRTRQSNLAFPGSARLSSDGLLRFVICAKDPGLPNWLDTTGRDQGTIFLRWQGVGDTAPPPPRTALVKFDEIRSHVPQDEPRVNVAARRSALTARLRHLDRRFDP